MRTGLVTLLLVGMAGGLLLVRLVSGESLFLDVATAGAVVVAAAVPLVTWAASGQRPAQNAGDLADRLAAIVLEQWEREAAIRHLRDPQPLTVRWTAADPGVMDWPDVVGPPRPGRPGRRSPHLDGRIDQVVEQFLGLRWRRLVVIGGPGSGKTGILVLLTLGLLERREAAGPVPVQLTVSSWNPQREPYLDWLPRHLADEYPILRPRAGARLLLEHRLILPILDGLDEMPEGSPAAALQAINHPGIKQPIVIACRRGEFTEAVREADVLTGAAVVDVQPVEPDQAIDYLRRVTPPDRAWRWEPVFAELRRGTTSPIRRALSTPLMVSLARAVYALDRAANPGDLVETTRYPTAESIEDHLLDALITTAFGSRAGEARAGNAPWNPEQARRWLAFLARQLQARRTRDLAWWELARTGPADRLVSGLTAGLLAGLLAGLGGGPLGYGILVVPLVGLLTGLLVALGYGRLAALLLGPVVALLVTLGCGVLLWVGQDLLAGLLAGLVVGFVVGLVPWQHLRPARVVLGAGRRSLRQAAAGLTFGVRVGLAAGLAFGLAFGLVDGLELGLAGGLTIGLLAGLSVGLAVSLVGGLAVGLVRESPRPPSPEASLRDDRSSSVLTVLALGLACGLGVGLVGGLFSGLRGGLVDELQGGLRSGLVGTLVGALAGVAVAFAGRPWPWYQLGRARRALRGQLPWRLRTFLDRAHQEGILRQVGAAYQFRHARLQDRLAGLPTGIVQHPGTARSVEEPRT